jgi:hypothetical protein
MSTRLVTCWTMPPRPPTSSSGAIYGSVPAPIPPVMTVVAKCWRARPWSAHTRGSKKCTQTGLRRQQIHHCKLSSSAASAITAHAANPCTPYKVADLDHPTRIDQDIRRLQVCDVQQAPRQNCGCHNHSFGATPRMAGLPALLSMTVGGLACKAYTLHVMIPCLASTADFLLPSLNSQVYCSLQQTTRPQTPSP